MSWKLILILLVLLVPAGTKAAIISIESNGDTVVLTSDGSTGTVWCGYSGVFTTVLGAASGNPRLGNSAVFGAYFNGVNLEPGTYSVREWKDGSDYAGCSGGNSSDEDFFVWDGENIATNTDNFPVLQTYTRFTDLFLTGTSTVTVNVEYFLQLTELDPSIAYRNPSDIRFSVSPTDVIDFSTLGQPILPWIQGYSTTSHEYSGLADGEYALTVNFGNLQTTLGGDIPFSSAYVQTTFIVAGGILTATGTVDIYTAMTDPRFSQDQYIQQECSFTNIQGCFNNAAVFLFVPNADIVNAAYQNLALVKSENAPFSQIQDIEAIYATLQDVGDATSTPPEISLTLMGVTTPNLFEEEYISADTREAIRYLSWAAIWVAFGVAMWSTRFQLTT